MDDVSLLCILQVDIIRIPLYLILLIQHIDYIIDSVFIISYTRDGS